MMFVGLVAVISAPEAVPSWPRVPAGAAALGLGVMQFLRRYRYDDIAEANEAVVHAYRAERRPAPPTTGTIGDAIEEWRQRSVREAE